MKNECVINTIDTVAPDIMNDNRRKIKWTLAKLEMVKVTGTLILCQYMIALSWSAEASTSWSILNWTMLAWITMNPTMVQRNPTALIIKNNG